MDSILKSVKGIFKASGSKVKSLEKRREAGRVEISEEDATTLKDLFAMFRAATTRDAWILTIGILFTIIHGATYPIMAILIGNISETFIAQSKEGHFNSSATLIVNNTPATDIPRVGNAENSATSDSPFALIAEMFQYVGNLFGLSSTTSRIMTNEEFADCANTFSWYFIGFGLVVFISTYIQTWCWESTADHQTSVIRENFVEQVLRQDCTWFERNPPGLLMAKLTDDLERFRQGIGYKFSMVVEYFSAFAIGALFGLCINARLTLIFGISVPFIIGKILYLVRLSAAKGVNSQEKCGEVGSVCEEVISEVRTVAAFGREMDELDRYDDILGENTAEAKSGYILIGLWTGVLFVIIYGSLGLAVLQASHQLLDNHISRKQVYTVCVLASLTTIIVVFCCATVAIVALSNILPYVSDIAYSEGCSQSIESVTTNKPRIDPYNTGGIKPHKFSGNIKFMNVVFSYPGRAAALVLRDFNLTLTPGAPIAILGSSGSGKSTLKDLLIRFYDPLSGSITFDDFELRQLNLPWLRHNVGVVNNTSTFMNDTIYHNITCRRAGIKLKHVISATRTACAHDLIMELPNGYRTVIGSGSRELSASLKQLIGLARVLVRKPKVIILDEALSSQSTLTGLKVMRNLKMATRDSTLIIFSHHVSRLQLPGVIIHVLKDGKIVEIGDHTELMEKKGVYYQMAVSQNADTPRAESAITESDLDSMTEPTGLTKKESVDIDKDVEGDDHLVSLNYPTLRGFLDEMTTDLISWSVIFIGILGCIISGIVPPIGGLAFCQLLITFSETGKEFSADAVLWCEVLFAIGVTAGLGHWMRTAIISYIGEIWCGHLRKTTYITTIRQAIGWFDIKEHSPERLYNILSRHPPIFEMAVGGRLGLVISAIVSYITAIVISFVIDWRLALVIVAIIPVQLFILYKETKIYQNVQLQILDQMDNAYSIVAEAVKDIRTVQSLSLQTIALQKFRDASLEFERFLDNISQRIGISFGISEALSFITFAAIFRVGAYLIESGSVEPIGIFKIFVVTVFSTATFGQVTSYIPDFVKAKLAYAYLSTFGLTASTIDAFETTGKTPRISGRITFKDVEFSYEKRLGMVVLRGVSFDVKPGTFLGICGSLGKSTILALLLRFYECDRGQVLIDWVDVKKYKLGHMRSKIGYVEQNPGLLKMSIRENILYGYDGDLVGRKLQKLIEDTVELLHLTKFIDRLPEGYDTVVSRHGLTNGERQRIAIARAVIRNPKILLLDMPTSALDPEMEMSVANALKKIAVGRTCIIVSNHPNVIRLTDYVAVLRDGQVLEYGTHEELENRKGAYCEFMTTEMAETAEAAE